MRERERAVADVSVITVAVEGNPLPSMAGTLNAVNVFLPQARQVSHRDP